MSNRRALSSREANRQLDLMAQNRGSEQKRIAGRGSRMYMRWLHAYWTLVCRNCHQFSRDHVHGQCLFMPTMFQSTTKEEFTAR